MDEKERSEEKNGMVQFTNGMLERFSQDTVLMKLLNSNVKTKIKFRLYEFSMKVLNSPEMAAYTKSKEDIIKAYMEEQKAKNENNDAKDDVAQTAAIPGDHPEMVELLGIETSLKVKKLKIHSEMVDNLTVADMLQLSWIIEFIE